jgi:phosphoribosylanthranilate isomerase
MGDMRKYGHVQYVGVFVNARLEDILATMDTLGLSFAQLHGDESIEMLNALEGKSFKAFRGDVDEKLIVKNQPAFLLDAAVKDSYGGTGVKADWSKAAELAKQYSFLLAGGLTPENVADAIKQVKPWGVDVASGVESELGKKDAKKISAFIKAVREVDQGN